MLFDSAETRFRAQVLASLQRIERALGLDTAALKTLLMMETSMNNTLATIAAAAQKLADDEGSAQVTVQHELDAAKAHAADLEQQLADAKIANSNAAAANAAPAVDQATLDAIAANLAKAQAIADALNGIAAPATTA